MAETVGGGAWREDSPSAWRHRLPLLALALVGLVVASYLTLYQVGIVGTVWDPVFGSASSQVVLHSFVSQLLPVPDAALGALAYAADLVLGSVGGRDRWRTAPWLVLLLGLAVFGFALVSLGLVVLQATVFHAWCALCLVSAMISLLIPAVAWAEVWAALAWVRARRRRPMVETSS